MRKTLTKSEVDALKKVGFIGADRAAKALSQIVGETIGVDVPSAGIIPLPELPGRVGGKEELVVGIYLPIRGDVKGSTLILFPQKSALMLADLFMKKEMGTAKNLDKRNKSALEEIGNILSGYCLAALSDFLGMELLEYVPDLTYDMGGAVMEHILVKFGHEVEQVFMLKIEFNIRKIRLPVYFFLLFSIEEAGIISKAIKARAGG